VTRAISYGLLAILEAGNSEKIEIHNRTLQSNLNDSYSKIRIIASVGWSPLLMHMAYKNRIKKYNEIPNKVIIFIDQTDIGDDFCRYRPYVHRDKSGNLVGVSRKRFNAIGGMRPWKNTLALEMVHSGWHLLLTQLASQYL